MIYDRYYYSLLSVEDKKIYKKIYKGIESHKANISVPKACNSSTPLNDILYFVGLDNPHIFYVNFNKCTLYESSTERSISFIYWYSESEIKELNQKVDKVLKKMLSRVSGSNDFEKELSVHDLIVENVLYDDEAAADLKRHLPISNSIMGVLFYKSAVCEGVAKITKLLLNLLDIKCIVAVGHDLKNNVPHAWNIVKINGKPYHLDTTWDMGNATARFFCYEYFNLNDSEIMTDHKLEYKYPKCDSLSDNYYVVKRMTVKNKFDVKKCILKSLNCRHMSFKCIESNDADFNAIVSYAVQEATKISITKSRKTITYTINDTQHICTINF